MFCTLIVMRLSFPERLFTDEAEAAMTGENDAASRSIALAAVRQRIRGRFFIAHHRTAVNGELAAARKKMFPG
jgi:predicted glutamine amidotransferase